MRAGLSALGIAIGVAAIVAVLGLSSSSQAGLLAEIDRLGTNLLTVTNGQGFSRQDSRTAARRARDDRPHRPRRKRRRDREESKARCTARPLIPTVETNALSVQAASLDLLHTLNIHVVQGRYLNAATAQEPVAVLGSAAARAWASTASTPVSGSGSPTSGSTSLGILGESVLTPEIESSVLVGFKAAERYLQFNGHPNTVYLRAQNSQVAAVQSVLAATADPEAPNEVDVSQPSATLTARADAQGAFNGLFLGLGAVALLVGAVGVANIMVISVLERRSEIGLRRALGATRGQIRTQFLSEAILLALGGGAVGVAAGALATAIYATTKGWAIVIPAVAWAGGFGAALLIGAVAGLVPALRAARLSPTEALRTV